MEQIECPRCLAIFTCRIPSSGKATCSCSNCGCRVRLSGAGEATVELPASRSVVLIGLVSVVAAAAWAAVIALT